jgi:hypothetical protein
MLETAVANVRWMAQFAKPLAAQALRAMVSTAGSATNLAGQLVALGRPIALAMLELATELGLAELAAALALPLGIIGGVIAGTAEPTSSNDMVPPRRSRPVVSGATQQPTAPPSQAKPVVQPQPAQPVKAAQPDPVQVRQNQSSVAAAATLTRANTATPNMYAAVEKFYDAASGGRAARANGGLVAPMQAVRKSRNELAGAITRSEQQIAASAPQDRASLTNWHDTLVKARVSIDRWLASADAFSAGLSGPGGTRAAQPPLPPPPAEVVNAPGSQQTGAEVGRRLVARYEGANSAIRSGARNVSPTSRTVPATPNAPSAGASQAQTARAFLVQAEPITQRLNAGVEAFYQQAAGGQAARRNGALTDALTKVTESKAALNKLILASNKSIAASGAAEYPALDRQRTKLREARDAIDAWLPKANAFAAGLSGPGGKPVAKPALPEIPSVSVGAEGDDSKATTASWSRAHDAAGKALQQNAAAAGVNAPVKVNATSNAAESSITLPVSGFSQTAVALLGALVPVAK